MTNSLICCRMLLLSCCEATKQCQVLTESLQLQQVVDMELAQVTNVQHDLLAMQKGQLEAASATTADLQAQLAAAHAQLAAAEAHSNGLEQQLAAERAVAAALQQQPAAAAAQQS
jgi:hypothetical protein